MPRPSPRGTLRAAERTQRSSTFPRQIRSHADRCSRLARLALLRPRWVKRPVDLESGVWVTCDVATSVPILVFLGLSVLDLGPMYATDRSQKHRLMSQLLGTVA